MAVTLLAGLGNPGAQYADSRHNVGFWLIDAFARDQEAVWSRAPKGKADIADLRFPGRPVRLLKPRDFMNQSGSALAPVLKYFRVPPDQLAVIVDDINLEPGRVKISVRGSAGGHNGLDDVLRHIGPDFVRFRIGIGAKPQPEMDLADFVLGKWTAEERTRLDANLPKYLDGLRWLLQKGPLEAMNRLNRKERADPPATTHDDNHPENL
ncbi:MAG: aminoacyl-tRNA hydrolase [Opitutales bacterium]